MMSPRGGDHDTELPFSRHGAVAPDPLADLLTAWRAELDTAADQYVTRVGTTGRPETAGSTGPEPAVPESGGGRLLRFPGTAAGWRRRSVAVAVAAGVVLGTSGVAAAVVSPVGALGLLRGIPIVRAVVPGGQDTARATELLATAEATIATAEGAGGITRDARDATSARLDRASDLLAGIAYPPRALRAQVDDLRRQLAALPDAPADPVGTPSAGGPDEKAPGRAGDHTGGSGTQGGTGTGPGTRPEAGDDSPGDGGAPDSPNSPTQAPGHDDTHHPGSDDQPSGVPGSHDPTPDDVQPDPGSSDDPVTDDRSRLDPSTDDSVAKG
jgi:hypothetical protein